MFFDAKILEKNDKFIKVKLNDAIELTIDYELLETQRQVKVDYDDALITEQEAAEMVNTFLTEMAKTFEKEEVNQNCEKNQQEDGQND